MTDLDRALERAFAALAREPDAPSLLAQAGALLAALARPREALPLLQRAAEREATPQVLSNLGAVLRTLDRSAEAVPYLARAVELAPDFVDARYNLAGALAKCERYAEAFDHYRVLVASQPSSCAVYAAFGLALQRGGRHDEALAAFARAVELDPASADALAHLGNAQVEVGLFDEAVANLERAIALAPQRPEFYRYLSDARPEALTSEHRSALESLARDDASLSGDERIDLHFALGSVYRTAGDPQRSFRHLVYANEEKRRFVHYDERETLESLERTAAFFDVAFLQSRKGCSDPSALPIFIFGMPRSGTTLIEQILASLPGVHAAGELTHFERATNALSPGAPIRGDALIRAGCDELRAIARRYVDALNDGAPSGALRITDKMPANFRYAGLIHTVLPNARMIHAMRDPIETCLSCFSHYFAGDLPWAYDLGELGRYYRGYRRLMAHWRAVLPAGAMLDVRYEDVVMDLEGQARRIVAFCGLDWDAACLEFHRTQRPVRTISASQVRKPIYRTSLQRSQAYAGLLQPLIDALKEPPQ